MLERRVSILGGGLAGLVTAIHLSRQGISCLLYEKNRYPFHRVCGEYISNEVVPYLRSLGIYPEALGPSTINRFQLTSINGGHAELELDLGGFGISRFAFDEHLYRQAQQLGVEFLLETEVTDVQYNGKHFTIATDHGSQEADIVVGTFGKRSRLDKQLTRGFMQRHSPYMGVKYHIRLPGFPNNLIALHNFQDGYCGISRIEKDTVNLCYLTHRNNVKKFGSIKAMEEAVLFRNPFIRKIFDDAEFLFQKPETINEISFETKSPLEHHILMAGDAAGMITPLCGNGMAMAIHGAKILSEHVLRHCTDPHYTQTQMERDYADAWKKQFAARLWAGRHIQRLFGKVSTSNLAVQLASHAAPVARLLMKRTHGKPF